jgi:exonuclease SbcC
LKSGRGAVQTKQKELERRENEAHSVETGLNRERPGIQARAGVIEKEITEAEGSKARLTAEKEVLAEIEGSLNRRDFAAAEERLLAETLGELSRLKYDETTHRALQTRVAELEPYAELHRRLEEADRLTGAEQEAYTRTMETIRATQAAGDWEIQRKTALDAELILLPQIKRDTATAEKERQRCVAAQREIETTLYAINAKLERFVVLEKLRGEKRLRLARVAEEENIYKDLGQAFGKKGVQQMFIEAAIPEIEAEANKLLSRMTDNRMHLKFETLRQSRRGDALETLDINIADELGTRDYEMYSGGEAFRINFAIRIALSRLLARRAGAPLRTLIIDEGFGTQDATGIEKIKEAIGAIQEDFERILVVTHIEELRDAFPNRINVVKGPAGSTIEIM